MELGTAIRNFGVDLFVDLFCLLRQDILQQDEV